MTTADDIENELHQARSARVRGDVTRAIQHVRQAIGFALDAEPDRVPSLRMKLSKALFDAGGSALDGLDEDAATTLETFVAEVPDGARSAIRMLHAHQNREGYADIRVPTLWDAVADGLTSRSDREGSARARLGSAWAHMLRADAPARVSDLLGRFEDDPKHSVLADAVLHTRLCGANWALDDLAARAVLDHSHLDVAAVPLPWIWIALAESHQRFGTPAPVGPPPPTPYALALAGETDFGTAMQAASGPEWRLAVWQSAHLAGVKLDRPELQGCELFRLSS